MHKSSPDDLSTRQQPDDENWESPPAADGVYSYIPLERFQTLEHIIREHPINVDPYMELANIYFHQRRWLDAKRILDLAVEKFPECEDAIYLREETQLNRSLQLYEEARAAHIAEPTRLTQESLERCNIDVNVLREKVCRSRLERFPDQIELYLTLARALESLGREVQAIQCLQKAAEFPQLRARAALQLGKLLERAKRIPEALSAYRKSAMFRVPPASDEVRVEALTAAAHLAESSGLVDSALRYVRMLAELQPNNPALQARIKRLENTPL